MKRMTVLLALGVALLVASCGGGGVGSGGTGLIAGGVGSGGTGITVGPLTGFGSIFVNGIEFDTQSATTQLEDASTLQLGMTVEVTGTTNTTLNTGVATTIVSAADLRGEIAAIDLVADTVTVLGVAASVDNATVFDGVASLAGLSIGDSVQIYGLIDAPGSIRATRIAKLGAPALPVVSGTLSGLNTAASTFNLGALTIQFGGSTFTGGLTAGQLVDGMSVRVRASASPVANVLTASTVQPWYAKPQPNATAASLAAVVTDFTGLASFKLLGVPVNAAAAQITGGSAVSVGNGVKVDVVGAMTNGTLIASKLKIRHIPGTGGPASFNLAGTIGAFVSSADFRVQGNKVDASGGAVVFVGGTASALGNGVKVNVVGAQVVDGVLIADTVTFTP